MPVVAIENGALAKIGLEVARSMASAEAAPGGVFISTPLLYPSGTSVVIRIQGSRNRFFVSDMGMGYDEAQMINAGHGFAAVARELIRDTGISFDSRSFFVAESSREDLVFVVGAVANLSQRAVIETALKHEAKKADQDRTLLLDRLDHAFGRPHVERDVEIRGASTVQWEVTARIVRPDNVVSLFDHAKAHKNSVTSTVAKFHDISRLTNPPRRIVAVRDMGAMGNFIGLLSQAANVIDLVSTPDDVLQKLAA